MPLVLCENMEESLVNQPIISITTTELSEGSFVWVHTVLSSAFNLGVVSPKLEGYIQQGMSFKCARTGCSKQVSQVSPMRFDRKR